MIPEIAKEIENAYKELLRIDINGLKEYLDIIKKDNLKDSQYYKGFQKAIELLTEINLK